jgi:hypothetical protein
MEIVERILVLKRVEGLLKMKKQRFLPLNKRRRQEHKEVKL